MYETKSWGDAFAGIGLGALTGLLLGLSVSQTVASVITALAAVLAGFFGLSNAAAGISSVRIGAFGIACAMAVVTGVWLRAGDRLSTAPVADVKRWTDAGFSKEEALGLVAFERLRIQPKDAVVSAQGQRDRESSLQSSESVSQCETLGKIKDDRELLRQFAVLGDPWDRLAGVSPDVARAVRDLKCSGK